MKAEGVSKIEQNKESSFFAIVRTYQREIDELISRTENLNKPAETKLRIDNLFEQVFSLCEKFEQTMTQEEKIQKLRKLFTKRFRKYFRIGKYNRWVIDKPLGYAGDYWIIDQIYQNKPTSEGVEKILDDYFLNTPASIATRNRKEDFKGFLKEYVKNRNSKSYRFLDLACGPCRVTKEFLEDIMPLNNDSTLKIDCLDNDKNALEYAGKVLEKTYLPYCKFIKENVARLIVTKNITKQLPDKYDYIYSAGLFDYLDDRVAKKLIANLYDALKPGGILLISNYTDKWRNPSRFFMEWGGDWDLIYRSGEDFTSLFISAGIDKKKLSMKYESQKIMQYCFAEK